MKNLSRLYTTARADIVHALVEKFKEIDGEPRYLTDLGGNVHPRMLFWDEVKEFPAIHVSAGTERRVYQGGGHKDRYLNITVRGYVEAEDPVEALEKLLADVEYVVEENGRLAYTDKSGAPQSTRDILIMSIDTDEGALAPLGVGEIILQVSY